MTLLEQLVTAQFPKMLRNLDKWLEEAATFAKTKSFDPETLLDARLAPDMYTLRKQIQSACDSAKLVTARLSGNEAPKHEDGQQTLAELRERLAQVLAFIETCSSDLDGAEQRNIVLPFLDGKALSGQDYLAEFAMPNFMFHVTTAYAILRHNGVELTKRSYIGSLNLRDTSS